MKYLISLLLCLFTMNYVVGQNSIKGKIIDKETKEPLAYANIQIVGTESGCLSNSEGEFNLSIVNRDKSDTINISYMGYNSFIGSIERVIEEKIFRLTPAVITLAEVEIEPLDPREILAKSIMKMKENFWDSSINIDTYYRETVSVDEDINELNEAICNLDIEKFRDSYSGEDSYKQLISTKVKYDNKREIPLFENPIWESSRPTTCNAFIEQVAIRVKDETKSEKMFLPGGPLGLLAKDILNFQGYDNISNKKPKDIEYKYMTYKACEEYLNKSKKRKDKYNYRISESMFNGKPVYKISCDVKLNPYGNAKDPITWIYFIDQNSLECYSHRMVRHGSSFFYDDYEKEKGRHIIDSSFVQVNYKRVNNTVHYSSIIAKSYKKLYIKSDTLNINTQRDLIVNSVSDSKENNLDPLPNSYYLNLKRYAPPYNAECWKEQNVIPYTNKQRQFIEEVEIVNRQTKAIKK